MRSYIQKMAFEAGMDFLDLLFHSGAVFFCERDFDSLDWIRMHGMERRIDGLMDRSP
jgi:hypothetical protein